MASPKSPRVIAKLLVQQELQNTKDRISDEVAQKFAPENRNALIAEFQEHGFGEDAKKYNDADWAKIQQAVTLTEMYNAGLTAASAYIAMDMTRTMFGRIRKKYPYCAWFWQKATSSNGRVYDSSERARKFRAICSGYANGEDLKLLLIYNGITLKTFNRWTVMSHLSPIWEDAQLKLNRKQIVLAKQKALEVIQNRAINGAVKEVNRTTVISRIDKDGKCKPHTQHHVTELVKLGTDAKSAELLLRLDEDGKLNANKAKEDAASIVENTNFANDETVKARMEILNEKIQNAEAYKQSINTQQDDNYRKFVNASSIIGLDVGEDKTLDSGKSKSEAATNANSTETANANTVPSVVKSSTKSNQLPTITIRTKS